ncbi:proteasome subunit alpha type-1-like [Scaptodrosophila lebanonensis]|uniref:Proteasome subunit alpha type n=1 Tax=Drosophila lebanonensis TaxID=7225 RepID=A0A6J2U7S1_DROLE|nr:proteasome subunit alpha type-1-like [Scaptodrosophila lebanonensis]
MFRSAYENDVTVFSPQGRLHQVEYAMEAVKLGTVTVGLKSEEYAVLIALNRPDPLMVDSENGQQRKIMAIDSHIGISTAGLMADARRITKHLRSDCLSYNTAYQSSYPVARLFQNLGIKLQSGTQTYDRRPYGVGILGAGYDDQGTHIFQVMPSANVLNCKAMAIGARSQGARSYLERHLKSFADCTKDQLICHGIQAIRASMGSEEPATDLHINVAIVGKNTPFRALSDAENQQYYVMAKASGAPLTATDNIEATDSTDPPEPSSPNAEEGTEGIDNNDLPDTPSDGANR